MPAAPTTARRLARTPAAAPLRAWQHDALAAMEHWREGCFLMAAAPGAGKTRPAIEAALRMLGTGEATRVVVAAPTAPLTRQWAQAAARLGLQLEPDAPQAEPPKGFHGVAVTYARIAQAGADWASAVGERTLVIADEAHHLGDELAWGVGFTAAFGRAKRWMLLSGTPFRSDATPIPGVRYDADGMARPDVSYGYADAVRDRVCRPVTFIPFDGTLTWRSGEDTVEASFADAVVGTERSRRYRTAISTELADGLPRILADAHRRLADLRAGDHPDAGGLVIAADGEHARRVAKVLHGISGEPPTVVLHTDGDAHRRLREFTEGTDPWIVAVNMVSEGVDVPRLRVGVYSTAAKTAMIFRQIVGRFVRTIPGRRMEASWVYLPADPVLRAHAGEVDRELVPLLKRKGDDGEFAGQLDDEALADANRLQTEPDERPLFEALSADVAPAAQLDLFGETPTSSAPASPELASFGPGATSAPDADADVDEPFAAPAGARADAHALPPATASAHLADADPVGDAAHDLGAAIAAGLAREDARAERHAGIGAPITPVPVPGVDSEASVHVDEPDPGTAAAADGPEGAVEEPLWEKRGRLRAERQELVGEVSRRQKMSHRQVNSWVNREAGVTRVTSASVEQLERSIRRLERTLGRR